jgi:PadR family transcriptional regulator, regulatory protein AphA
VTRTSTTAHAVLGLLALRRRWATTELTDQIGRNMRFFWPRAASRVFAEAKGLVEQGWATSATEPRSGRGAPTRTLYRITPAGRRRVRDWMATRPRPTTLECEALLRVLLADLGTVDDLRRAVQSVASDADDIIGVANVIAEEYLSGTAPFQDDVHVRALVFDYLAGFATNARDWAGRAEAYVDRWSALDDDGRTAAALDLIRERVASLRETG